MLLGLSRAHMAGDLALRSCIRLVDTRYHGR